MPRPKSASVRQLDLLLFLMEENRELATGRFVGVSAQRLSQFWRDVTTQLNSTSDGCTKSPLEWRRYWHELKYRAKRRSIDCKLTAIETSSCPVKNPLSILESRILQLMGSVVWERNTCVEIPSNFQEPVPMRCKEEQTEFGPIILSEVNEDQTTQDSSSSDNESKIEIQPNSLDYDSSGSLQPDKCDNHPGDNILHANTSTTDIHDLFAQLISHKIRRLNPRNQSIAQHKIHNIIFELEMNELESNEPTTPKVKLECHSEESI